MKEYKKTDEGLLEITDTITEVKEKKEVFAPSGLLSRRETILQRKATKTEEHNALMARYDAEIADIDEAIAQADARGETSYVTIN